MRKVYNHIIIYHLITSEHQTTTAFHNKTLRKKNNDMIGELFYHDYLQYVHVCNFYVMSMKDKF